LFSSKASFANGTSPEVNNAQSVASGDFNGDGITDLLVGRDADTDSLFLFFGNGELDGFSLQPFSAKQQTEVVFAQDLNGDARTDFAALDNTNERVTVFFSKP
jgi:FG-GAP-like repeat